MTKKLLLLPGDGIGIEVVAEAVRVLEALDLDIETSSGLAGGSSIDACGLPITDEILAAAKASDAVLLGAVGGPKWAGQSYDMRPEVALLRLRSELNVFANLRPVYCMKALADASTLKREVVEGLDILFVRELISGIYFGEPRGVEDLGNGEKRGVNTHVYTSSQIRGVARVAFDLARDRKGEVCSVDKANVMEAGLLWREEVQALHDADYPNIELSHMLADNCAMQLVKAPRQFDVIVTDNLFGDILSDAAAMLTGSLGMLPSGSIGLPGKPGIYEPIHGSAPDIAGRGIANPSATILSLAMALRYSLDETDAAARIDTAVDKALTAGARTADIGGSLSTRAMGDAIIAQL